MIAIAIDDEPPALKIISKFCEAHPYLELKKTFTNPVEAVRYMKSYPVDLLFADIDMPSMNGMDLYKKLETKPLVIFTTAYSAYAVEGFNVNAVDYLLKPYTRERFLAAVDKAYQILKSSDAENEDRFIYVRSEYSLVRIKLDDILLLESLDDYITIHLLPEKKIVVRMTLKKILEMLPETEFVKIHRSFIVPLKYVEQVRHNHAYVGGKQIPIGQKFKKNILEHFKTV
ncbi:LytTR family DNA-binding domain-containing protein [Paludibacter sp.]